jgi:hypothetical protein
MNAKIIRCQNDLELYKKLLEHPDVIQVKEMIARIEGEKPMGLRRRLLSSSVRLSRGMAPEIHTIADECIETLGMKIPLELYVFASPQFNAMCFKPEDGRLFVMFASSLLESFTREELRFVMGHELGHHIYGHHNIPIGYLLGGDAKPDPRLALELFTWSRYAEISADRAGAHCSQDLDSVARSLFKLASGLSGKTISFNLNDFLNQIDDMQMADAEPGMSAPKEDWFSTHPFSPLRVKALKLYDESEYARSDGMSKADLEIGVQGLMGLMEPSYMEGKTETAKFMRRLLYAGAIAIADASDGIGPEEIEIFEKFFGPGEFSKSLDVTRLKEDLDNRVKNARNTASVPQRMQVLRDLCLVAQASGRITSEERKVLEHIADGLDISRGFIFRTIKLLIEPD